ncbi:hypothetical protein DID88_009984 [Monilinia fructigena]|uniref:DNA (cytosine-5-)-methyltransferase n=1 Tax=Monilinia fructigena TaxID=38457 RepID=A0A395IKH0_9HELO|nr:hypothetical protein DID88_009984 [Monilinia fructigena]
MLADKLNKTCLVRFYTEKEISSGNVPAPYCRDGSSNAFIITMRLREDDQKLIPIEEETPESLIQGFDPRATLKRRLLNGLDLFCGGGNFGRGLEEGGALHNRWAVDLFSAALMICWPRLLMATPKNLKIPLPGDVDVISAGSPCQGFSKMNANKSSEQSLRNQSLVASVAAYIDFYRPKYGLLENVLSMAQKGSGRDEDVLSQLICAIVGLGYQVQLFLLDSWSFGSSQSRSRIFVSFAAPGCAPIEHPQLSHSHPPNVGERGLGKLANGQSFGSRLHYATPFRYRTAEELVADLPYIGDGATSQCTRYPDHVSPTTLSKLCRNQIACIPTHPRGMNFWKTWNDGNGTMTQRERETFPYLNKSGKMRESVIPGSRAWGRIKPDGLFPTVLVIICVEDSRMGTVLHWDQHRRMTILELRRAQSFPDDEVLLGTRGEQIKLIAVRDKPRETSSTTSSTIQVVLNKLPKVGQHTFETSKGVTNGTEALSSSSSESIGPSLSDSIANLRGIPSNIRKKRSLLHNADKPARKSPRLSPAIDLPSMARELFAKSMYNFEPLSRPSLTSTPPARNISMQSGFEARQEYASPGLYSASPPSRTVHTHKTNTPRNTNNINEQPPSSRENPIIIDDSENDEDTIRVQSGPRSSTLPSQNTHLHTETPKASSRLKNLSSKSLHSKNTRCIV